MVVECGTVVASDEDAEADGGSEGGSRRRYMGRSFTAPGMARMVSPSFVVDST